MQDWRDAERPKRPSSSYILFILEQAKLTNSAPVKIILQGGAKWKSLTEEEKAKYFEQAQANKRKYEEEMSKWEAKMIQEGRQDMIRLSSRLLKPPTVQRQKPKSM